MRFMLDTNICIELIRNRSAIILAKLQKMKPGAVCISSVTLSELEYGVAKSSAPERNRMALMEFVTPIEVVPYDDRVAPHYGRIRADLERRGKTIGSLDTMIAAHALCLKLTVVTSNVREFARVPGLKVENWAK